MIAIEGGFGVTIQASLTTIGPGQAAYLSLTPSESGVVVECLAPAGSNCARDAGTNYDWIFTAPATGGVSVLVTVRGTLNGVAKNFTQSFSIATSALDTIQLNVVRANNAPLSTSNPGETVTVTAIAQSASGNTPTGVLIEPTRLLGLGAQVSAPLSIGGQPAGRARVQSTYTTPRMLVEPNTELFRASLSPTVSATRSLGVAAFNFITPLGICAAASISASASSNIVNPTFEWQLNTEPIISGPTYFRNVAVAGNLRVDLKSNGILVVSRTIIVITAGCTVNVVPSYLSLLPGQTQQFSTNPPASNITWLASNGTITTDGLYTAPPAQSTAILASVYAKNLANNQIIGTAFVQLSSDVTLSLTPDAVTLGPGQSQTFTYVLNPPGGGISLEYSGTSYAPITSQPPGQITISVAPNLGEVVNASLKVISAADYTKTAIASIQLRPNVSVTVNAPNGATALRPNRQTQVVATVTGANDTSVTWELTPNVGTIAADGWYSAPATIAAVQTISVRARSLIDPSKSAATTLTLKPGVTVTVSPTSAGPLGANATQQFTATVTGAGSPSTAITWSVYPNGAGSISSSGLFAAPADSGTGATINVRATSVEDPLTVATANVTLQATNLIISPNTVSVRPNESVQFNMSLPSGGSVPPLTWWVQQSSGASITSTGLYTAPSSVFETTNTYAGAYVTANSNSVASAWVILNPAPPLWVGAVDPVNSFSPTQSFNFRARDSSGSANIDTMTATFQTPSAAFPECQILYTVSSGNLKLFYRYYDNYWGQWFVGFYNGQVGGAISTMNNGACSVTSAYSSDDGYQRTLTLGMSFTPGPVYQVSRAATNLAGNSTGNVLAGTWRTQPEVTIAITPTATTLGATGQQQFGVNISGTTNTAVTWALTSGPGTINSAGLYVAPATISSATSATVRATSNADPAKSASATITLPSNSSIAVNMLTPTGTVTAGQTYQLGASVSGTSNTAVSWTLTSGSGAVGLSTGLYTAPAVVASTFTATLRATSVADPSRFASATLTVNPSPVTITINPTSATLTGGQSAQFAATVGGTSNTSVNWSVSPASAGSVNTAGYFTAGNVTSLTSATLTATSAADATKSASASLTIQQQSPVTLVSFTPASIAGDQSVVILTGRSTSSPIKLSIAVGDEFQDPYNKDAPCSFYWSGSIGGLGWTGTDPGSGSTYLSNASCAVSLNSTNYDSATGNWTLNVTVISYAWGNKPLKAQVSSPAGATPWTIMGYWNR